MQTQVFINLCVSDLPKSMEFFKALGFSFNPKFTNEEAACMQITDSIFSMLITPARFKDFTKKDVVDAKKATEVLIALSYESKEKVNEIADKALAAGATPARDPEDIGFMFTRAIQDLDGHIWEFFWMDSKTVQ
ncbi:hypothetical protein IPG41_02840 [Candidatus Peregrinibacteria bacterium]|nr:MAG: hypothetical protein IPG41_02840 [Candidatus Peregrinibacteria bacterium]